MYRMYREIQNLDQNFSLKSWNWCKTSLSESSRMTPELPCPATALIYKICDISGYSRLQYAHILPKAISDPSWPDRNPELVLSQLAFYLKLYWTIFGLTGFLSGQ